MLSGGIMQLTNEQLDEYHREGFTVVENLVAEEDIKALRERLEGYTRGGRDASKLSFQVVPYVGGAKAPPGPGGGIQRIEGLVRNDDLFQKLGLHPNIVGIVQQILGPDLKLFRDRILLQPRRFGLTKWLHQDPPYWPIEPMSLCTCWLALTDVTFENGCMQVFPRGQKQGPLQHIGRGSELRIAEGLIDKEALVDVPIKAGVGLFFHSLLPHCTAPNEPNQWRRAIALTYMSSTSKYTGEGEGPEYLHVSGETYPGCVR